MVVGRLLVSTIVSFTLSLWLYLIIEVSLTAVLSTYMIAGAAIFLLLSIFDKQRPRSTDRDVFGWSEQI